ncbi:hypothetical protein ACYSNO_03295 [Enterococcus sp. LJL98]
MIQTRLVQTINCYDNKADTFNLIESICFNTIVLDLKSVNHNDITHIIITKEMALMLSEALFQWSQEVSR